MADSTWEEYGKKDPYYGVLTDPKFKSDNLNEKTLNEFFQTGEEHIKEVSANLQRYFPGANPANFKHVLDFGCGTGRLIIPMAKKFENVTGVDISEGMLAEAQKNLAERNLNNVSLIRSGDISTIDFKKEFDFVHTFIVLQHIPLAVGYKTIDKLIACTKPDGYGMIQITYANHLSSYRNKKYELKAKYKIFNQLTNLLKGKNPNTALMQMNNYHLPTVFEILKKYGIKETVLTFTDHGGYRGACIYFHKPA